MSVGMQTLLPHGLTDAYVQRTPYRRTYNCTFHARHARVFHVHLHAVLRCTSSSTPVQSDHLRLRNWCPCRRRRRTVCVSGRSVRSPVSVRVPGARLDRRHDCPAVVLLCVSLCCTACCLRENVGVIVWLSY